MNTDLIEEKSLKLNTKRYKKKDITIIKSKYKSNNYTTIYFSNNSKYNTLLNIIEKELNTYIHPLNKDKILVVGLGNKNICADSLGPKTIENVCVTSHLKELDYFNEYKTVSTLSPGVITDTGINSTSIIKSIIKEENITKLILVDSLKSSKITHLLNTIQITDSGISPGSGINNNRGELSYNTTGIKTISIGIPTIVDINTISNKYKSNNIILTPIDIDLKIKLLSKLISTSLNKSIHNKTK